MPDNFEHYGVFDTSKEEMDVSIHGIEKWLVHLYEHLGWMTLADKHENYTKVISYINSINKIEKAIANRKEASLPENKKDLEIHLNKVMHLREITDKLFDKKKLARSLCEKCDNKPKENKDEVVTVQSTTGDSLLGGAKKRRSKKTSKKTSKKGSKSKMYGGAKRRSKKSSKKVSKKVSKKSSKKSSKRSRK